MTVQIQDVMESPKKRILRRKFSKKVNATPIKPIRKVPPMPAISKQPKRRHPSSTTNATMNSDVASKFEETLTESSEMPSVIKFRRRNPSNSTRSASEALLALKNSALIFSESQKKGDETISPFLKLPKSMGNTEISNVTNISHIFSSPTIKSKPEEESEKEDSDLSYPSPSKKAKSADSQAEIDDFQLKTAECFLPPSGDFLAKDFKVKRNDYQAQIDELKAKNDDIQAKSDDLKAKMVDFKVKSDDFKTKSDDFKAKIELLALLECSSCKKLPKNNISRPNVYGCSNGHLVCQNCVDIVQKCPMCTEKDVKHRDAFAERIMNKIFPIVQKSNVQCRFDLCKAEFNVKDLKDHERFCVHREVPCPSTHRGACSWTGPLSKLIQHVKENKCVQVQFDDSWYKNNNNQAISSNQNVTSTFKSNLGDFPSSEKSVFDRNDVITHWKPVLLLSKKVLNLWCYVVIQRDSQGLWKLMAYSMLPKDCTDQIKIKITVGDSDTGRSFNFSGKLTSYETSSEQAMKEGNFLHLHDAQVKPFKLSGQPTLFDYSIELEAEAKLISKINLRSQKISMNGTTTTDRKITDKDIPKMPKLTPKPAARFNVTFDNSEEKSGTTDNIGTPKFNVTLTKVKMEPTEVQID